MAAAAAAKSLQSCPTLCNPMDCSPPGSSIHGLFQARVLEWSAIVAKTVKKKICLQCRKPRFNPWVKKIPCRRKWQLTPVFLPREFHGQKGLVGYGVEVGTVRPDLATKPPQPLYTRLSYVG